MEIKSKVEELEAEVAKLKALIPALVEHLADDADKGETPTAKYLDGKS